ncbi:hypothetical protein AB6O49_34810 [Streptomyces sp. SBR177]
MRARTALLTGLSALALALSGPATVSAATQMDIDGEFQYYYYDTNEIRHVGRLIEPPQAECIRLSDIDEDFYGFAPHNLTNAVAEIWDDSVECQGLPKRVLLPNSDQQPISVHVKSVKFRLPLP